MLSLSSAKAGSRAASGASPLPPLVAKAGLEGVVCDARREVRDGGRSGVLGREGGCAAEVEAEAEGLRAVWEGVAMTCDS